MLVTESGDEVDPKVSPRAEQSRAEQSRAKQILCQLPEYKLSWSCPIPVCNECCVLSEAVEFDVSSIKLYMEMLGSQ